jgi:hypothetical protein
LQVVGFFLFVRQVAKQNEVIRRLQAELHQLERNADEVARRTRTDAERQEAADKKNSDGKMGKLQHDLGQVRAQYSSLLAQHRESEQALRKVNNNSYNNTVTRVHGLSFALLIARLLDGAASDYWRVNQSISTVKATKSGQVLTKVYR